MKKANKDMTRKEEKELERIDSINVKKNAINILKNPSSFFEPYLKNIKHPLAMIFAKFSILIIIKKTDSSEELCEEVADHFIERYSIEKWLDTLTAFYEYALSLVNFTLENHDNTILDLYNEGGITKDIMKKGMKSFVNTRKQLLIDKEQMNKCIEELEEEKKGAKEFLD